MPYAIDCQIIRDLLPLYLDGVCSEPSRRLVEDHLSCCDDCQAVLTQLQQGLTPIPEVVAARQQEAKPLLSLARVWQKVRRRSLWKGMLITALTCGLLIGSYLLAFTWNIRPVASEKIAISEVCQLTDGSIAYHVTITDGKELRRLKYQLEADGSFYMIPLRPLICQEAQASVGLHNMYDKIDLDTLSQNQNGQEIKALYYGAPGDAILLWQQGQDLPAASPEIEQLFQKEDF